MNLIILYVLVLLILLLFFKKKSVSNKFILFSFFITLICMFYIVVKYIPKSTDSFPYHIRSFDLFRYYFQIDYFRNADLAGIISFIFEKNWFIFRLIELLVAKLFTNNVGLLYLSIPFTFGILIYIIYDLNKVEQSFSKSDIAIFIIVFLSIINPLHLFSGIRNSICVALFSLGLYIYHYKNKQKPGIALIIASIFVHPMSLIYIFIILFSKVSYKVFKNKWYIGIFIFLICISFILLIPYVHYLTFLPKFITEKSYSYSVEITYYNNKILILELLQLFMIFSIINKSLKLEKKSILLFLFYITFCILGCLRITTFYIRTRFAFAFLMPVIYFEKKKNNVKTNLTEFFIFISSTIIYLYYLNDLLTKIGGIL